MSESKPKPIIWYDMDQVISDWEAGVFSMYSKPYSSLDSHEVSKFWNRKVSESQMFRQLEEIGAGMNLLHSLVGDNRYDIRILTSTGGGSRHWEIVNDKADWLVQRGFDFTNVAFCAVPGSRHKVKYVTPNAILIDDNVDTITEWNDAGGHGLLFTPERSQGIYDWIQKHYGG